MGAETEPEIEEPICQCGHELGVHVGVAGPCERPLCGCDGFRQPS